MAGQPCPGEGLEESGAHRGQAGVPATPVRGVGRQGQQQRQLGAEPVGRSHGELGDRHADVHVQRERGLAASECPQAVLEHLIARAAGDLGFLANRKRMGPGGGRGQAERPQLLGQRRPERRQLGHGAGHGGVHSGLELERAGVRLGAHLLGQGGGELGEELVHHVGETPVARVEQHHLLLDSHRPCGSRRIGAPDGPVRQGGRHQAARSSRAECSAAADTRPSKSASCERRLTRHSACHCTANRKALVVPSKRLRGPVGCLAHHPQAAAELVHSLMMEGVDPQARAAHQRRQLALAVEAHRVGGLGAAQILAVIDVG